jgi:hypothetical protein
LTTLQVAPQIGARPEDIETTRLKLAELVIGLARNRKRDARTITATAVQLMFTDPTCRGITDDRLIDESFKHLKATTKDVFLSRRKSRARYYRHQRFSSVSSP